MNAKNTFPRWLFAFLAAAGLFSAGIVVGVMSVTGVTWVRLIQAGGYGIFGLLMFWGALSRPGLSAG